MQTRALPKERQARIAGKAIAVIVVFLIITLSAATLYFVWRGWQSSDVNPNDDGVREVTPRGELSPIEKSRINICKMAEPSVVHVISLDVASNDQFNESEIRRGSGSGFIWDKSGYVVTNFHVVRIGRDWRVTLYDGTTWKATLKGIAPNKDLAVLKIDAPAKKLVPIKVGTSADLQVGQTAYAIGSPFGLKATFTTGVVSGIGRTIKSVTDREIRDVIQTDAAINPGNSGGPLLDSYGRLIGVNTAIVSPSGAYAGIGFAIPVDEVRRIVPQLIQHGKVIRPGLGIGYFSDEERRQVLGSSQGGMLIKSIAPDSAAMKAGLRGTRRSTGGDIVWGDLITAVNGKPVRENQDLFDLMDSFQIGDTVTVTVLRDGRKREFRVTLQEL